MSVRHTPSLGLAFLALGGLVSCAPVAEDAGADALAREPAVDTVDVALLEYAIGMPRRLQAGTVTFKLSNQGFEMHNLKFFPAGTTTPIWQTKTDVNPGETRVVSVDLAPGTYNIRCDVAGHDTRGMQINIEVEESGG